MTKLVNRAKMTTATTGTGTITLGSAVDGYQTFADAGVANADVVRYVIEDGDAWEIGTGTYTATGTTLSRSVLESSNADSAINLSGAAIVFVTAAAADIVQPGDNISIFTNDAGYTTNIGDITGVTAGAGLSGGGTSGDVTLSHSDTSSQASVNNSGATVIQDVTLDTYGHVTALGSTTLTATDVGAVPLAGGTMTGDLTVPNLLPPTDNTGVVGNATFTWSNGQFTDFLVDSVLSVRGAIDLADSDILRLGSDDDWEFFHDGSNNYIDLNVGDMIVRDTTTTRFTFARTTGDFTATGNVTAYSDLRLKTDLQPIDNALDKVMSLAGYTYERIDTGERQTGVIAQDVQKVLPEAVRNDGEHLAVAYGNMVGLLIEAIKEQQVQIEELKHRLEG